MNHAPIVPVVLCGGSGTRLWPVSRQSFPKQFAPIVGDRSLLQMTLERLEPVLDLPGARSPQGLLCVAAEEHRFLVLEAMRSAGLEPARAGTGQVILEPAARNTAAAIALAALRVEPECLLLVCPADHHIRDTAAFAQTVQRGRAAAERGEIVTFGVLPSFPSTAYGYVQRGAAHADGQSYRVLRFIEKPGAEAAQALLLQRDVFWNAGIFLMRAATLLQAMGEHAPDILASCRQAMDAATVDACFIRPQAQAFSGCRSQSIDYAVLEHARNIALVPFEGAWSDVGSWNAVAELHPGDDHGNRVSGQGITIDCRNTFIHAPGRPVVGVGTEDLLIIDTPDALLVARSSHVEQVKEAVAKLGGRGLAQATTHRKVARPWGWYDSVDTGERHQVKRIRVNPGAALSLQRHRQRAEHWIVVQGTARVTKGDQTFLLQENESTYIPIGETHRLENPGPEALEIIEVQSGTYLGEDDIERFEDRYGRG